MTAPARNDIYQTITDHIIAGIEAGAGDWKMPWRVKDGGTATPMNAVTNRAYRGVNVIMLWRGHRNGCYLNCGSRKQYMNIGLSGPSHASERHFAIDGGVSEPQLPSGFRGRSSGLDQF